MPVQLRRSAVAWQLPRRVHLDHRQGRLRGREAQRPRRRPTRTMARGGPSRPWHAARAHRRPGDASAAEGARNARQGRGRRPVRRARFRHRTLAPYHRGAIRRPSQRDAVDDPCRLGEGLRPRALEDQEPRDGRGGRAVLGQAHRLHREALGTRYVDRVTFQGSRTRVRQLGTVRGVQPFRLHWSVNGESAGHYASRASVAVMAKKPATARMTATLAIPLNGAMRKATPYDNGATRY